MNNGPINLKGFLFQGFPCYIPSYKTANQDTKERFLAAHPELNMRHLERGDKIWTHLCMTGGKFRFGFDCVPEDPEAVQFGPDHPDNSHNSWMLLRLHVQRFLQHGPRLLGRGITYDDVFWVIYDLWLQSTVNWSAKRYNYRISITECRTPVFCMYMDMDMLFQQEPTAEEWKQLLRFIASVISKAVSACFPATPPADEVFLMTVMSTQGCTKKGDAYKRGVHLVWPNLHVDENMALILLGASEMALTRALQNWTGIHPKNSWYEILDASVYRVGLRLVGCPKNELCPKCGKNRTKSILKDMNEEEERESHEFCPDHLFGAKGFMFRPETAYKILTLYQGTGGPLPRTEKTDLLKSRFVLHDTVTGDRYDFTFKCLTSIRTDASQVTEGLVQPAHLCIKNFPSETHPRRQPRTEDTVFKGKRARMMDEPLFTADNEIDGSFQRSHKIDLTPDVQKAIQRILQKFHRKHNRIIVERVIGYTATKPIRLPSVQNIPPKVSLYREVIFKVKGEGSQFCVKKGADHSRNTIKFHLTPDGILVQGCWSPNMHNGQVCKNITSKHVGIVYHLKYEEFPTLVNVMTTPLAKDLQSETPSTSPVH